MKNLSLLFILLVPVLSSCQKQDEVSQYTEVVSQAPHAQANPGAQMDDPHAGMNMPPMGNDGAQGGMMPGGMMSGGMGAGDPHAGFTKEQLQEMLKAQGMQPPAMKSSPLSWTVPEGWQEKPGNGMRVATLVNKTAPEAVDCSIVTLGSGAGGIAPNIIRWMQQIHIAPPAEAELNKFIEKQDHVKLNGDFTASIFDFTTLQNGPAGSTASMVAAIIDTPSQRIFVKMTGTKQKIQENLKQFKALVQSVKIN